MHLWVTNKALNYIITLCVCTSFSCSNGYEGHAIALPPCQRDRCVSAAVGGTFYSRKQPTAYCCWATALAMLYSWKKQQPLREKAVLEDYPEYVHLFDSGATKGITVTQEIQLYTRLGLSIERQLNPTIKGWAEYITEHGPLSIIIVANPPFGTVHAIILVGIYGADSGLNTRVVYADPADGKMHDIDFLDFMKMYEAKYSVDWPIQIIHF